MTCSPLKARRQSRRIRSARRLMWMLLMLKASKAVTKSSIRFFSCSIRTAAHSRPKDPRLCLLIAVHNPSTLWWCMPRRLVIFSLNSASTSEIKSLQFLVGGSGAALFSLFFHYYSYILIWKNALPPNKFRTPSKIPNVIPHTLTVHSTPDSALQKTNL